MSYVTNLPIGITVHCIIRNEPLIDKVINAVYPFVDTILLWDTGSDDGVTIPLIEKLLEQDIEKKIDFQQVPIDFEEWKWSQTNIQSIISQNKGKRGVGYYRKKQIEATKTSHFMVLDGDEVHYEASMKAIRNAADNWDYTKICGFSNLIWMADMAGHTFPCYSPVGRLFLTEHVGMTNDSPNEMHTHKSTGGIITFPQTTSFLIQGSMFAHFEHPLKPWRRTVRQVSDTLTKLPEVFDENNA